MADAETSGTSFGDTISEAIQPSDGATEFTADGDTVTETESKSWFQR
jgi:hypothetical protein